MTGHYHSREIAFFRSDVATLVDAFVSWEERIFSPLGWRIRQTALEGHIDDMAQRLAPASSPHATKYLFAPCGNGWVCFLDNGPRGTDAAGVVSVLSDWVSCEAVRLVIATRIPQPECPAFLSGPVGYKALILSHHSSSRDADMDLYSANDGGRWVHGSQGPLRDVLGIDTTVSRAHPLTLERLLGLCAAFDLHPVESSWYGRQGMLVTKERVS